MKRSNAPVFWLLFGAGGMLSALFGTALVVITGVAAPLGLPPAAGLYAYPRMLGIAQHGPVKALLFLVIALFAWHAVHRILHSLHDLGLPMALPAKLACYGTALALTLTSGWSLLTLGT